MYRASTNPPQTAWARHLDQVMRDRQWSRVRLFEEVGAELGYSPKSRSALLPLLIDKEPDETQAAVLRHHFGEPPPEPTIVAEPEPSLAAALNALTEELTQMRLEREAWTRGVAEVLRSYEDGRVPADLLDALVPQPRADVRP